MTDLFLSVEDVSNAYGVAPNSVRNWIERGWLRAETRDGRTLIAAAEFESAKVLRDHQFLALQPVEQAAVTSADLIGALLAGAVAPTDGPDRRFSRADARSLVAWKAGGWRPVGEAPRAQEEEGHEEEEVLGEEADETTAELRTPERPATETPTAWGELCAYVADGDPRHLSTYWDAHDRCPEFVPPAGVARYVCRGTTERNGRPQTRVWRTNGYAIDPQTGHIIQAPGDSWLEDGEFDWTMPPPRWAAENLRWHTCRRAWVAAWRRHRELAGAIVDPTGADDEPPDPLAFEREYHESELSPRDAPDWVFSSPTPLAYTPRTNVFRFTWGEPVRDDWGMYFTPVVRSAGWLAEDHGQPRYVPVTVVDRAPGRFQPGVEADSYEWENREAALDRLAWTLEGAYRRARRGGVGPHL